MRFKRKVQIFQMGGQSGGGTYSMPAYVPLTEQDHYGAGYKPVEQFRPQKPKVDKSQFQVDKSALEKIMGKGHTNAVNQVYSRVQQAENVIANLSDLDILSNTPRFQQAMSVLNDAVNPAVLNKLERDLAMTEKAAAINEKQLASSAGLTFNGQFVVEDQETGDIVYISPIEYAKNRERYRTINSAEGLRLKDVDPRLSFNDLVPTALQQTYGIEYIRQELDKALSGLGYSQQEQTTKSLETIQGFGEDFRGFYEKTRAGGSNAAQLNVLKNTMWDFLDPNQQAQLMQVAINKYKLDDPQQIQDAAILLMSNYMGKAYKSDQKASDRVDVPSGQLDASSGKLDLTGKIGLAEGTLWGGMTTPTPEGTKFLDGRVRLVSASQVVPKQIVFKPDYTVKLDDERTVNNVGVIGKSNLANLADINNTYTANGIKVDPNKTVVTSDNAVVTYAYKRPDGTYVTDMDNPDVVKFSTLVNNTVAQLEKQTGKQVNAVERERIEEQIRARDTNFANMQRVVVAEAFVHNDDVDVSKGDKYFQEMGSNWYGGWNEQHQIVADVYEQQSGVSADKAGFGDDFYRTVVVMPVHSRGVVRTWDNNDLYAPKEVGSYTSVQGDRNQRNPSGVPTANPIPQRNL